MEEVFKWFFDRRTGGRKINFQAKKTCFKLEIEIKPKENRVQKREWNRDVNSFYGILSWPSITEEFCIVKQFSVKHFSSYHKLKLLHEWHTSKGYSHVWYNLLPKALVDTGQIDCLYKMILTV